MIEAAEALIAHAGLPSILSGKARLRSGGMDRIALSAQMNRLMLRFMAGEDASEPADPALDYDRVLEELTEFTATDPQLTVGLDVDTANEVVADVQRAVSYLRVQLPIAVVRSMTGVENVRPSEMDIARFRRVWSVGADPLVAFRSLVALSLMADQVAALQSMFPSIYEAGKQAAEDAIIMHRTRNPKWKLPYRSDLVLGIFLQEESLAKSVGAKLQAQAEESRQNSQRPKPSRGTTKTSARSETPTQRAANM